MALFPNMMMWKRSIGCLWLSKLVVRTLPCALREQFPTTFAIIDGTEIFIETPTDLQKRSSTWTQYKHHNTAKVIVAWTPNWAICYISPVYVGSISDIELTRICGFLTKWEDKPGISIIADHCLKSRICWDSWVLDWIYHNSWREGSNFHLKKLKQVERYHLSEYM